MMTTVNVHREFVRSRQRLNCEEQKAVDRLIRMIMAGELTPGMRRHHVGAFLSLSPNMDLRIVSVELNGALNLLYVDHHDKAYSWASGRKPASFGSGVEVLPSFIGEREESDVEVVQGPAVLDRMGSLYGQDENILQYIEGLSPEWQEWFFRRYVEKEEPWPEAPTTSSFTYCLNNDPDVNSAITLDLPDWQTFLHPKQRHAVQALAPILAVTGGPGTGKTVVLLSRLLSPTSSPNRRRVLLTYSQSLVNHYRDVARIVRNDGQQSFSIFNVEELVAAPGASKRPTWEVHNGVFCVRASDGRLVQVEEMLVDEFQDCPDLVINKIAALAGPGLSITVGGDLDQTLFRKNQDAVAAFIHRASEKVHLSYCYRSSKQLVDASRIVTSELRNQFGLPANTQYEGSTFALSGLPLAIYSTRSLSEQVARCDEILLDALKRYPSESVAVIYLQYPNPAFKGNSKEEAALKNHPRLGRHYVFASLAKGREYFAGVVFVSNTFMGRDMGQEAMRLRANTMFVALSRFRDECSVVFLEGSVIEPALRAAGIAL